MDIKRNRSSNPKQTFHKTLLTSNFSSSSLSIHLWGGRWLHPFAGTGPGGCVPRQLEVRQWHYHILHHCHDAGMGGLRHLRDRRHGQIWRHHGMGQRRRDALSCKAAIKWGVLCQKQVSRARTSNCIPQTLITCPYPAPGTTLLKCCLTSCFPNKTYNDEVLLMFTTISSVCLSQCCGNANCINTVYEYATKHDDVIKWKHFPRYCPFVRGIHRSPVNSPLKGQWRGALMFSLICARINGCVNNREAGDLRRYRAHYDVIVMFRGKGVSKGVNLTRVFRVRLFVPGPVLPRSRYSDCWWESGLEAAGIQRDWDPHHTDREQIPQALRRPGCRDHGRCSLWRHNDRHDVASHRQHNRTSQSLFRWKAEQNQ